MNISIKIYERGNKYVNIVQEGISRGENMANK